jgi:regulatory protein YycI of two-component signal transduction system YycFG
MDWGRAKTILICSFLVLNLILGFQLWKYRFGQSDLIADTSSVMEETSRFLSSKNIHVTGEIPKDAPKLKGFTAQFNETIKSGVRVELGEPYKWNTSGSPRFPGKEQLQRLSIDKADSYQLDPALQKPGVYTFTQMYGQLPLFDIKLELFEENGEITAYQQTYVDILPSTEQQELKEQKVIPAYTAIRALAESYLPDGVTIVDVRLGFHGQLFNSQTQFMFPYWRVATDDGQIYYVHAFTGAVEPAQSREDGSAS